VNPRQRRGVLLLSLAGIGAVVVFVLVSGYLSEVRSQLGPTVAVLVSTDDLPPLASPNEGSLSTVQIPQRWLPPNALQNPEQIGGRITAAAVPANTILSEGMFLERFDLEPGQREIAIMVDAETGVGGKITAGAIVDVFATFAGSDDGTEPPSSRIVLQRAEVLAVGSPVDVPDDGGPGPGSVGFGTGQRVPVTFRLSIEDANRLVYVESFALSVRLALRSPLDDELTDEGRSIFDQLRELGRAFDPVGAEGLVRPQEPEEPPAPQPEAEPEPEPEPEPDEAPGDDVEVDDDAADDGEEAA
jgi:pilus assembly protein CpaB